MPSKKSKVPAQQDGQISFDATIERLAPEVPRFVVFPGDPWSETGTFLVDVSLNGIPIGLRNLIPWKERGWHFGLSQTMCSNAGVETGAAVHVEMRRLGNARPSELEELLTGDSAAQAAWNALSAGEQRDFILFVADARKPETRMRRARRLLAL